MCLETYDTGLTTTTFVKSSMIPSNNYLKTLCNNKITLENLPHVHATGHLIVGECRLRVSHSMDVALTLMCHLPYGQPRLPALLSFHVPEKVLPGA